MSEKILATTSFLLDELGRFQGFTQDIEPYSALLDRKNQVMVPRDRVEENCFFKQIIPYVLLVRHMTPKEGDGSPEILAYSRLKKGNEQRLRGASSLGFGGHIQTDLERGTTDELLEEVFFSDYDRLLSGRVKLIGLINDDEEGSEQLVPVGAVHLGVVMVCFVGKDEEIEVREKHKIELIDWMSPETLKRSLTTPTPTPNTGAWESWSRLVIENIDTILEAPNGRASFNELDDHLKTGQMLAVRRRKRCMVGGNSGFNGAHGFIDLYGYGEAALGWYATIIRDDGGAVGPVFRHQLFREKNYIPGRK